MGNVFYQYKTASIPANIVSKNAESAAADLLQSVIDEHAVGDWEFYRVDTFSTAMPVGCFSFGQPPQFTTYNVAAFRREMDADEHGLR